MESYTQTSKTILELANLESCSLSSDSLTQSPRGGKSLPNSHIEGGNAGRSVHGKAPLTFARKNSIRLYLEGHDHDKSRAATGENKPAPMSLTKTFLQNKGKGRNAPIIQSRSQFLQQTSPFSNPPREYEATFDAKHDGCFKSQSYVESSNRSTESDFLSKKPQLPITRFTVKNIKEQPVVDNILPLRRFYPVSQSSQVHELGSSEDEDGSNDDDTTVHLNQSKCMSTQNSLDFPGRNDLKRLRKRGKSLCSDRNLSATQKVVKQVNKNVEKLYASRKKDSSVLVCPPATRSRFDEDLLQSDFQNLNITSSEESTATSHDSLIYATLTKIRNSDWSVALKGLGEMVELCRIMDPDLVYPHMTMVNQRLLELLRSPRSHVCRTACQAAGHLFESVKDTHRPEFDDIVEVLLCKTADANKFIRKDSNVSLDCMVTHIPIFHSVRSLCLKGPTHKNPLVRTATIRLIICAVVIAGPEVVLNAPHLETTRKRIIQTMVKFLNDKDQETRKYAERLCRILCNETAFEQCLKRFLEKDEINGMKGILKNRNEKKYLM